MKIEWTPEEKKSIEEDYETVKQMVLESLIQCGLMSVRGATYWGNTHKFSLEKSNLFKSLKNDPNDDSYCINLVESK